MPLSEREAGMDLRDYVAVLRRRKSPIILTTLTVLGSTLLLSFLQTPVYAAKARLLIERDSSVFGSNQTAAALDPAFVETQMEVIRGEAVRTLVRERLRVAPPVSTAPVGSTSVVEVRAESVRPKDAAAIANAYVEGYLAYRRKLATEAMAAASKELQSKIDNLQRQIDALASQLNSLPPCPSGSCPQRDSLQRDRDALVVQQLPFKEKIDQLQVDSKIGTAGAEIVTPATEPDEPVRPRPLRNGAMALGLGLAFGVALALVVETLDDSISSKEDLERSSRGVPVLGMIPATVGWKDPEQPQVIAMSQPSSPSAESYRTLRTAIRFLAVDRPLRRIQVTSPNAGDGKTTTTANLALALSRAGERVVMVSADLRRPRLHDFFGLSNTVGFTSVVLGEAPLSGAIQRVTDDDRLWFLASGPLPPNPSELLSSARAKDVLRGLEAFADTIIIDCPPVLPVTDAAVLSAEVDGTLMVVAARSSTGKQVSRAIELLQQVGAPLVGTVLNKAPAEGADGYMYTYYGPARHPRPTPDGKDRGKSGVAPSSPSGEVEADPVVDRR